jgi:hypothetical protein
MLHAFICPSGNSVSGNAGIQVVVNQLASAAPRLIFLAIDRLWTSSIDPWDFTTTQGQRAP